MQPMTIPEIISAVDGTWLNPRKGAAPVTAVCTDSRKIAPGCLFLPWVGERFDGHDFIDRALDAGAAGCLCARRPELLRPDKFYIQVGNTERALRDLAAWYKNRFQIPFVGITGSVGKTTAKDMIAAVLSVKYKVLKTEGNFNNNIGLPLTLLLTPGILAIQLCFFASVFYLMLRLVQPENVQFLTVFRVIAYSAAPTVVCIVPLLGPFVGSVWFGPAK